MGKTIHEKRYVFGEAATITGIAPKIIRNWFDREKITLNADEEREGLRWRQFSMFDILKLMLIGRMNDFGVPVRAAELCAMGALFHQHREEQPARFAATLRGTRIEVWRDASGWDARFIRGKAKPQLHDTFLTVDVGEVAEEVAKRILDLDRS